VRRVTLYTAIGCHLCERARTTVAAVRAEIPFELEEVDITGDPELERRYRQLLPVVEIDGDRAFVYHVTAERLREALRTKSAGDGPLVTT
jgi:glutaredoxin